MMKMKNSEKFSKGLKKLLNNKYVFCAIGKDKRRKK